MKATRGKERAAYMPGASGITIGRVLSATILIIAFLLPPGAVWGHERESPRVDPATLRRFAELLNATLVETVRTSSPAVVSIITTKFDFDPAHPGGATLPSGGGSSSPRRPPKDPENYNPMRKTGIGSGTLVRLSGGTYVLTNHHVVHGVDRILIQLEDKREYEAFVKGWDSKVDIAVLELPYAESLPAVPVGDSDEVLVGELVLAVGSPFGLPHTVTVGIVSAVGRYAQGIEEYEDFIQTDASINRGNSGGPLLNLKGEVVGLNTAIRTTHMGGNVGIGFAIPMNMIVPVAEQLVKGGLVVRGWLGTSVQNITPDLARAFDLPQATGVVVTKIIPGSPAEKAGLTRGDIILQVGDTQVTNANKLRNFIASARPGSRVRLVAVRDHRDIALDVIVGQGPYSEDEFRPPPRKKWDGLGVTVQDVTGDIAAAIGLPGPGGALVTEVESGSPAGNARPVPLTRGDVILESKGKAVTSAHDLQAMIKSSAPGERVLLFVYRRGSTLFTVVKMPGKHREVSDRK